MRKPLLLICVVCCLLFSATVPSAFAEDRDRWNRNSSADWELGAWLSLAQLFHLPLLDLPNSTNIFNDGPEPVGNTEEEEENPEDAPDPEGGTDSGPAPLDSIVTTDMEGSRD